MHGTPTSSVSFATEPPVAAGTWQSVHLDLDGVAHPLVVLHAWISTKAVLYFCQRMLGF